MAALTPLQGLADTVFVATVLRIVDGDTIKVSTPIGVDTVRLYRIDTPEKRQPYGTVSTQELKNLTKGKKIVIVSRGRGSFGRLLGEIHLIGSSVNQSIVENGHAHVYKTNQDKNLLKAQQKAIDNQLGLWKNKLVVYPWEFRKLKRNKGH